MLAARRRALLRRILRVQFCTEITVYDSRGLRDGCPILPLSSSYVKNVVSVISVLFRMLLGIFRS